jgi:hypothetical protein
VTTTAATSTSAARCLGASLSMAHYKLQVRSFRGRYADGWELRSIYCLGTTISLLPCLAMLPFVPAGLNVPEPRSLGVMGPPPSRQPHGAQQQRAAPATQVPWSPSPQQQQQQQQQQAGPAFGQSGSSARPPTGAAAPGPPPSSIAAQLRPGPFPRVRRSLCTANHSRSRTLVRYI